MRSVELFAGAGGLALGTAQCGFKHEAVLEWDQNACDSIRENQRRKVPLIEDWKLHQGDVHKFDFRPYQGIDLLSGGPPCQPFSIGGKHRGHTDDRNLFPEVVRAVRETQPKAIFVENVKGLLRQAFSEFFEYVLLQLTYPELTQRKNENWVSHLGRLERYHTRGRKSGLTYNVVFRCLNAADYGVPQKRERVFIIGFRSDLGIRWSFPEPTHSQDELLRSQWIKGDYWKRHGIMESRPKPPRRYKTRVSRLTENLFPTDLLPWITVRDAIKGLPDPLSNGAKKIRNHWLNPGARSYPGHTGSPMDEPAKTLKAGDHGVPGGENMLTYPDGKVRYFTVRESARLQTFPDEVVFSGAWTEAMRQLGNAVPVSLVRTVAQSIKKALEG